MKDLIVQALTEIAEGFVRRGIVATPVDKGLLLRLAPVGEQAPVDGTSRELPSQQALEAPPAEQVRNSW